MLPNLRPETPSILRMLNIRVLVPWWCMIEINIIFTESTLSTDRYFIVRGEGNECSSFRLKFMFDCCCCCCCCRSSYSSLVANALILPWPLLFPSTDLSLWQMNEQDMKVGAQEYIALCHLGFSQSHEQSNTYLKRSMKFKERTSDRNWNRFL